MSSLFETRFHVTALRKPARLGVVCLVAASLAGCNAGGSGGQLSGGVPQNRAAEWQIDSLAARCAMSVVSGAIVGGLIGAAVGGNRGVGTGLAIGAGAGGVACAVMAVLDEQDKARIKEAQLAAARTGVTQELSYAGKDGLQRTILVKPRPVEKKPTPRTLVHGKALADAAPSQAQTAAGRGERVCRTVDTSAAVVGKGEASVPAQVICRNENGDWAPATAVASAET